MIEFIKKIAVEAGKISLAEFSLLRDENIDFKNDKDIVTVADRKVEEHIISRIREKYPDHGIFAEESGKSSTGSRFRWVIDPIDGTTSFVHGQPYYSVSIALQEAGRTICAVVNAPRLGELFWAEKGRGAFCNGEKMSVTRRDRLINSVLSTGFACLRANLPENNLPYFCKIAPRLRGIRRYGSAAIDLAYVASGRLEGFWEFELKPYDIAAGVLLVEEAGGHVCDFKGGKNYPEEGTVATNGKITTELLDLFGGKHSAQTNL